MSYQNDEIFQTFPNEEGDSGFSSSDASVTMPPLMSTSSSEAEEDLRPEDYGNGQGEPPTNDKVEERRFRINRYDMARHLKRFRLSGRRTNDVWTTSTKIESTNTSETEKGPSQSSTSLAQGQQGRSQDDQITKSANQPEISSHKREQVGRLFLCETSTNRVCK
ncbi:hypothetical protein SARC_06723 [Sphaeroforma arctica JP610]|uniref:Uncharacterized protein n=1 Tax=Sphaeroforma arctica JP610 TaxID=667725 RepID=A0A0L0FVQ8_9EUKA|nr:hypothetical protein SARC_06723 [Sphaeroforma arctica JP610]KNC80935.1 hypothetical protein SARC_06723 [Sphaeroforma arctica JP610]|eukprot:XP_014154837.1 hypothetical protein SARC_06723 [Sphaeroforma arctica JP610]